MTDQSSIKYISSVLDGAQAPGMGDGRIASLLKTYPYFVPVRYIEALSNHKGGSVSPAAPSGMAPYLGNWLMFCDFISTPGSGLKAKPAEVPVTQSPAVIVPEPKAQDISAGTVEEKSPEPVVAPVVVAIAVEEIITVDEAEVVKSADLADIEIKLDLKENTEKRNDEELLIAPLYTRDYFLHKGEKVPEDIPAEIYEAKAQEDAGEEAKSLMVMMSFTEWLLHFKRSSEKQQEETQDQKALKTMWQKEKLAAAMEEENEEIPEKVFEMAVNSISMEDGLASETLADIYIKQGKYDHAVDMYRKLSLRNPQKSAYFARKIEEALKDKQS